MKEVKQNEFLREEKGQIVILFTLGVIPFVFLMALIFNTAKMTIRKMEKQGATDSAAVTGGVWMARGMNLMALNNNGMVETVSVMITVRATLQTAEAMSIILPQMAAASFLAPPVAAELSREAAVYAVLSQQLRVIDRTLSGHSTGFGWRVMNAQDRLNQAIKTGFPALAYAQAIELAKANGADQAPYNLLLAGLPTSGLPMYPAARGPQRLLIAEAERCMLPRLKTPVYPLLILTGPLASPLAIGIFEALVSCNNSSLRGGAGVCRYIPVLTPPLQWPGHPPKPMILTDSPTRSPAATTEKTEDEADFTRTRQYLQYLSVSFAQLNNASSIGHRYFENPANRWLTYGQADVFNPSWWSLFKQDWRAQLVHSRLWGEKLAEVGRLAGFPALVGAPKDWAFINVH